MRTTIDIEDDLMRRLKELAAATNRTLRSVIEDAARAELARRSRHPEEVRTPEVITFKGNGTQSGVNLDNNADLLDLMEGE